MNSDSTVARIVGCRLAGRKSQPSRRKPTKSRRKATVVEIQAQAIAARSNRLCLPPSPEEEP